MTVLKTARHTSTYLPPKSYVGILTQPASEFKFEFSGNVDFTLSLE